MIFILISRQFIMSIAERKFELDLMRGYEESFRQRMMRVVSLPYECLPLNEEQYTSEVSRLSQSMKLIDPNSKDLSQHDEIILGKIQGRPALTNFKQLIETMVGEVSEAQFKTYIKQKTEQKNYGLTNKDKNCSVRQVKKIQLLKKYFDVNQINKRRKYNRLYSAAAKGLTKYFEYYNKIDEADPQTIMTAFQHYSNYSKEQKKFNNYVKQIETTQTKNVIQIATIVEEPILTQKEQKEEPVIEQERKIQEEVKQNVEKVEEQKKQPEEKDKTPKKGKGKNKQTKPQDGIANAGDTTEKEKSDSEAKKRKQQKQKEKALKKQEQQRIAKKNANRSLTQFFIKKKEIPETPKKPISEQEPNQVNQCQNVEHHTALQEQAPRLSIWSTFWQQPQSSKMSLAELRAQFRSLKMQDQQYNPEPYYTNVVITLSTLEYYDYLMTVPRTVDFSHAFERIHEVFYFQDESEEFEGESADQQAEEAEEENEESQLSVGNNTILDDDHLSNEELSSCEPYEVELKVEYGKANKWVFGCVTKSTGMQSQDDCQILNRFSMMCLESDEKMPLKLQQQEETVQIVMTPQLWREIYKIAHGYHGTKEAIIKDISGILPGISKTWIDSMLKQRSQKILNQRFIKRDFVDDIKEKVPEIDSILESVLLQRNEQLRKIKAEKNQQKDQKLQKDILDCTGSRYIVNLLKQLKEKGYKQLRRNQLMEFINERKGEQWEKINAEMNTMSRPIAEMIRNMPVSERIDEEVAVEDEEYNREKVGGENGEGKLSGFNQLTKEKATTVQVKESKGSKKIAKEQTDDKQSKQKKRKSKASQNTLTSIYEKTKSINRARKTKNSLRTGILSIDELKRQKEEQKLIQQDGDELQDGDEQNSQQHEQQQQNVKDNVNADNDINDSGQNCEQLAAEIEQAIDQIDQIGDDEDMGQGNDNNNGIAHSEEIACLEGVARLGRDQQSKQEVEKSLPLSQGNTIEKLQNQNMHEEGNVFVTAGVEEHRLVTFSNVESEVI